MFLDYLIVKAQHLCLWLDVYEVVWMEGEDMVLVVAEVEEES